MKICLPDRKIEFYEGLIEALFARGVVVTQDCEEDYDAILNFSAFNVGDAIEISNKFPNVPVVNYVWDYYKFAHEGKHWFNWTPYVNFLAESDLLIAPSKGQQLRLKELLNLESEVVLTGIKVTDMEAKDGGYVLDHMRWYPEENKDWIVNACAELNIPCVHSEHQYSDEAFKELVANATFLACGYQEASTGGLTLVEGLWNGKTALLSNSPYMGGKDYMQDFATYFQWDDYNDCKAKLQEMWLKRPRINVKEAREFISKTSSFDVMADQMIKLIKKLK